MVADAQDDAGVIGRSGDFQLAAAIAQAVVDEVAERALERQRLGAHAERGDVDGDARAGRERGLREAFDEAIQAHVADVLVHRAVLDALQRALDHHVELVEVLVEVRAQLVVVQHLGAQLQARDRRLQVVRDAREQALAILHEALDARLHVVERAGRAAQLDGAGLGHRARVHRAAEGRGCVGDALQRARERARDGQHQHEHRQQRRALQQQAVARERVGAVQEVRVGQRGGQQQAAAGGHVGLDHQHRRAPWPQQHRADDPVVRQLVQRAAVAGDRQRLRPRERHVGLRALRELALQRVAHLADDGAREQRILDRRDGHALLVHGHEEARAAHLAQLVDQQRAVLPGQVAQEADGGGADGGLVRGVARVAAGGVAQLPGPDGAAQQLAEQHARDHHQQDAPAQRGRQQPVGPATRRALSHGTTAPRRRTRSRCCAPS